MPSSKRKLFASFTATMRELHVRRVTMGDLATGYFLFGCERRHALEPWQDGTNELTWFWRDNPDEGQRVHAAFVHALLVAEQENRVFWKGEYIADVRDRIIKMALDQGMEVVR
jgi:hypothetical protein